MVVMFNKVKDQWNAALYDQSHSFVSKFGSNIVELLNASVGEEILDLGCGTGDIANQLYNKGVHILGIDKSENMVSAAKEKYPHIPFKVEDATEIDYDRQFDAVFSNATLHWVKNPSKALASIYKGLKSGGRFVAEFGGKGNVAIITNEIVQQMQQTGFEFEEERFPWFYPSIAEYTTLMEKAGFRVIFAQHIDRPTPLEGEDGLKNWITMFGMDLLKGIDEEMKNQIITNVENALKPILYKNSGWEADYKRIRVIGIKE
ncbi:methyltransferase domain-containing protein [Lysinibacillus sp. BW-2-10]|nr:methyltransferase domain-containing protein [Lysinibacillus sp. BW-2-10]